MGLDWRTLSLSDYLEALEAANEDGSEKKGPTEEGAARLAAVMKARTEG